MNINKTYSLLLLALQLILVSYTNAQISEPPVILQVSIKPTADNPGAVELWWEDNNNVNVDSFIVFKFNTAFFGISIVCIVFYLLNKFNQFYKNN